MKVLREEEFDSSKTNQKFEQIDSKINVLSSEVKEKLESVRNVVDSMKKEVEKIEEKHKETNNTISKSDSINKLQDMKNYLDYNKEYNKSIERERIEKKSKHELDNLILLKEKVHFRKRNSKSAEKYNNMNNSSQVHRVKGMKLTSRKTLNDASFSSLE